jgi:ATP-dependent DNA helicase RecG
MNKGQHPDLLSMTATPIPRTLALTAFGDLNISTIKTMPEGRKPVITHLTKIGNEAKVYDRVRKEIDAGYQAYFIYPLIQQSEALSLKDTETMFLHLKNEIYPEYKLGLIHSKIKEKEKEEIMADFIGNKIQILVATSVIEVGVDVPNANTIVIEHAERFGLAALHQLRGRVGRSDIQSYCFLIYSNKLNEEGKQRLKVMKESFDGFLIAEEDLKIRGPGEILGEKQSGFFRFKIADLIRDYKELKEARSQAYEVINSDPGLLNPENELIRRVLSQAPPFDEKMLDSG